MTPSKFDERCLPYTWFVPCYVQLSILLPIVLYVYVSALNKFIAGIVYLLMFVGLIAGTFAITYEANVGGTIAVRKLKYDYSGEEFFA